MQRNNKNVWIGSTFIKQWRSKALHLFSFFIQTETWSSRFGLSLVFTMKLRILPAYPFFSLHDCANSIILRAPGYVNSTFKWTRASPSHDSFPISLKALLVELAKIKKELREAFLLVCKHSKQSNSELRTVQSCAREQSWSFVTEKAPKPSYFVVSENDSHNLPSCRAVIYRTRTRNEPLILSWILSCEH